MLGNENLLDNIAFASILKFEKYLEKMKPDYFQDETKRILCEHIKTHHKKFDEIPTAAQLKELVRIDDRIEKDDYLYSFIDTLYEIDIDRYTRDWLDKNVKSYISYKQLDKSIRDLLLYLKTTEVKTENVDLILQKARDIITEGTEINFDIDVGVDICDPQSYIIKDSIKMKSNYNFIDTVTDGGFSIPGLHLFFGPPKIGKTLWLGNIALNLFKEGKNGAFISLEMPEYTMLQRFGPNMFNVKLYDFKEISQDPIKVRELIGKFRSDNTSYMGNSFETVMPGDFYLKEFPTSTATTIDVESYIRNIVEKKKIKLDFIVIDYINIMANWRNTSSENTYMKIKEIGEDLRAISQKYKMAVITATQSKRGTEEASDYGSGDIVESSGLNHIIDSQWGIIQTPAMYANKEYFLKCTLNRHGGLKNARKRFRVDYDYMRILETNDPIIENEILY